MKKSLVLAMAMALGVTASAYAANPFSDVPAGHWAYDSIDKLAAAGVIDGMGDGTYQGDKTMTRYEMAQIVAKAMAKGANVDKLAAEFADELDNLGVRVANLEKKADNVKITGNIRYNYASQHGDAAGYASKLRSRLWITGQINEDWSYTGMLENIQQFQNGKDGVGEETVDFQRAVVKGRIGGLKVRAGRDQLDDIAGYMHAAPIYSHRADILEVSYGKKVQVTAGMAQASNKNTVVADSVGKNMYYATAKVNVANGADVHAGYYKINDSKLGRSTETKDDVKVITADGENNGIFTIGFNVPIAKKTILSANYMRSDVDKVAGTSYDHDGYNVELTYGSLKKPGDWNATVIYQDLAAAVSPSHGMNDQWGIAAGDGSKGFTYVANYLVAKNITANVEYYDLKEKATGNKRQTLWSALIFKF